MGPIYSWRMRARVFRWYAQLREIDKLIHHLQRAKKGAPQSRAALSATVPQVLDGLLEYQGELMAGDADVATCEGDYEPESRDASPSLTKKLRMPRSKPYFTS